MNKNICIAFICITNLFSAQIALAAPSSFWTIFESRSGKDKENLDPNIQIDQSTTNKYKETIFVGSDEYTIEKKLGEGYEGVVWLTSAPDDSLVVVKQFKDAKKIMRNFSTLKRLERFLKYPQVRVVKIMNQDFQEGRLLLEYAQGIAGDDLFDEEQTLYLNPEHSEEFVHLLHCLNDHLAENSKINLKILAKNTVWNPEDKTLTIIDPF